MPRDASLIGQLEGEDDSDDDDDGDGEDIVVEEVSMASLAWPGLRCPHQAAMHSSRTMHTCFPPQLVCLTHQVDDENGDDA
jgi:hypothetical protein